MYVCMFVHSHILPHTFVYVHAMVFYRCIITDFIPTVHDKSGLWYNISLHLFKVRFELFSLFNHIIVLPSAMDHNLRRV